MMMMMIIIIIIIIVNSESLTLSKKHRYSVLSVQVIKINSVITGITGKWLKVYCYITNLICMFWLVLMGLNFLLRPQALQIIVNDLCAHRTRYHLQSV